ncbi:hypothetical protein CSIRO_3069 [Bradyrhizobiaceae bacterium SG-6C]|nr:hypothetical protein CSIRO_3069 [Bradyrhizobiaceae bacterium SG-6C]
MADNEEELLDDTLTSEETEDQTQEGDESAADSSEGEPKAAEETPKVETADETKRWRDEATQSRGQLATALRTVKALRDGGVLTDEQIEETATKAGLDAAQVKSVLNQEPAPANAVQANMERFAEQYGTTENPGPVRIALNEAHGEDTLKFVEAFDWLVANDPTERDNFAHVEPKKVASYVVRKGKEVFAEFEELRSHGSLLEAFRASKKAKAEPAIKSKERVPLKGGAGAPKQQAETREFTSRILG